MDQDAEERSWPVTHRLRFCICPGRSGKIVPMKVRRPTNPAVAAIGCFAILLLVAGYVAIGAIAVDFCLWFLLGKSIPWIGSVVLGLIFGEIALPFAFLFWVLWILGAHAPLFV